MRWGINNILDCFSTERHVVAVGSLDQSVGFDSNRDERRRRVFERCCCCCTTAADLGNRVMNAPEKPLFIFLSGAALFTMFFNFYEIYGLSAIPFIVLTAFILLGIHICWQSRSTDQSSGDIYNV